MKLLRLFALAYALASFHALAFAQTRTDQLLSEQWKFAQGAATNAEAMSFNAGDWQSLSIPHNWGWEQAQRGEKYVRGPGWYRRSLDLAEVGDHG